MEGSEGKTRSSRSAMYSYLFTRVFLWTFWGFFVIESVSPEDEVARKRERGVLQINLAAPTFLT